MSTEGSGETPPSAPSLPGVPEQTYLFPKAKGHSRSVSHGGTPMLGGAPAPRPLKSALRGHQRAFSQGQIGDGRAGAGSSGSGSAAPGHSRAASRTDFILPPGHRAPAARAGSVRAHSRQASRSDSIYTLRRASVVSPWRRTLCWVLRRRVPNTDTRHITVVPNHLVPDKTPAKDHPNGSRCNNKIRTTKYTLLSFLPKNLFEQFHRIANVYFIFIVLLNWVPQLNAFGKEVAMFPVVFVLFVTAIKDLFEDRRRHLSDKRINNSYCRVYKKSVDRYVRVKWRDVRVGDLVHLSNNEAVPADMVLLHSSNQMGICYLDTCNLDGETNLKQRLVAPGFLDKHLTFSPAKFRSSVEVERPSTKIYRFTGTISHPDQARVPLNSDNLLLRECTIKNTDFVEGIVVYAGHETKAMLNNGGPRYKCSKLERKMNTDIIWCVLVLLFLCCAGAVGCKTWLDKYSLHDLPPFIPKAASPAYEGLLIFWTFIIVLQVMIPVSLYVTIEMTKLLQVYHIHQDVEMFDAKTNTRTQCRALNITEELGQINYLFSDKTGTLTENKMVFRRCTVGGVDFDHPPGPPAEPSEELPPLVTPITRVSPNPRLRQHLLNNNENAYTQQVREFLIILAVCNTVVVSQPHVDAMHMSGSSPGDRFDEPRSNGTLRSNDKYARLTESRSTTPSPPPSTTSPLRFRLGRLPFGLRGEDSASEPSTSAEQSTARFEAESPDELALAEAALAYGYELRSRMPNEVELGVRGELRRLRVLRVQPFDSVRKCMSVALRGPQGQVVLYVKGADSTVLNALTPARAGTPEAASLERTRALLSEYSRAGLRTLVMAKRTMQPALWEEWIAGHARASEIGEGREKRVRDSLARLESALTLVGATGVEDRLQEDVPRTVRALLDAGVVVWVLTGDKPETAINIAYSAALFSQQDRLLHLMSRDKVSVEDRLQEDVPRTVRALLDAGVVVWVLTGDKPETAINIAYSAALFSQQDRLLHLMSRDKVSVEDRLQEDVPRTVRALLDAGVVVWVLTGDKPETAINIAYSAALFSQQDRLLHLMSRDKVSVEDRLQEDVPRTVRALLDAGVVVWVLTGDKPETAINIAYSAALFSQQDRLLHLMSRDKVSVEDRLQEDVPRTVRALLDAGVVVWVLTGDKPETAINIAYSAALFSQQDRLLHLMSRDKVSVEDRLQEDVPRTVRALLDAGVVVWVLTGDKPETAINIAYSAALFSQQDRLLHLMSRDKVSVEDRLQEDVPRTVRALLDAGVVVWVLTGDKPETAINIAYSAALFSQQDRLLHLMSRDKVSVEDRLQEDVPRTVRALLDAGVVVWVLTGDKPETAINIAYSAALFSQQDRLLHLMSRDKVSVEDRLQEDVPRTVRALLDAGVVVWVLTGDKPETAINIAYSAALFSQQDRLLHLMSRDKVSVEDRLQEDVPRTVRALLDAGVVVWVLTGDKPETAINIAYSAALFSQQDRLLHLMSRDKVSVEDRLQEDVPRTVRALLDAGVVVWVLTGDKPETAINIAYSAALFSQQDRLLHLMSRDKVSVEDRLQEDVPRTVRALLDAGVVVWVLTGDKPETAINIAYSAALFSQQDRLLHLMSRDKDHAESTIKSYLGSSAADAGAGGRALVVDGRTLTYILDRRSGLVAPFLSLARRCSAVLCCRATPLQKAYIVKAVKEELGVTTLAIGDGANDVSMIQTADVGVGLSGQEGRQAVMASDFALSRFKFVERLLLVHGHWCYDRLARMILYFFLKNTTFVFMVFWYQLYCGFSSAVMVDQLHMMTYNLVFTAFPPLVIGAYDRVAPATLLSDRPGLYGASRRGLAYRTHSFWAVLAESVYISVVIFFTAAGAYWDSAVDFWAFGICNMTCCLVIMLAYVAIETRSWTVIHALALTGSLGAFFVLTFIYQSFEVSFLKMPSTYHVLHHALLDPVYWLVLVVSTVAALAPRLAWHAAHNSVRPGALGRAVLARRRGRARQPYAAHYHCDMARAEAHVYRSTDEDGLRKTAADVAAIT